MTAPGKGPTFFICLIVAKDLSSPRSDHHSGSQLLLSRHQKEGTPMKKCIPLLIIAILAGIPSLPAVAAEPAAVTEQKTAPEVKPAAEAKPSTPTGMTVATEAPPAAPSQTIRIGYVDMAKAATECTQGKSAMAEMKAKTEKYKGQIEAKQKQLEKQKAAIEAKIETMTPQQRAAKAKEFQKKVEEFQKYVQNAEKEMRAKEEDLSGKIFKSLEKATADYGKANGYAAVVAKKELLYMGTGIEPKDLTEEIIKAVDATEVKK
jgi:outer membrane protein